MNTKKQLYKFVGIFSALIYLLIVVMAIFTVEDFELLEVAIRLLAIFFTPAIYLIFAGIGEILDFIQEKDDNSVSDVQTQSECEEDNEPVQMEINLDDESANDLSQEDKDDTANEEQEINEDENIEEENTEKTDEDETVDETKYEPVIKNGKIQCRYCGKYNSMKRTYCYLCAKKLKD